MDGQGLVGAGDYQAEYQVWLCAPTDEFFIESALLELRRRFPGQDVTFTYLPPNVPVQRLLQTGALRRLAHLIPLSRPLLRVDEEGINGVNAVLLKKTNKIHLSRLRREGNVCLQRIADAAAFSSVFDEIIVQYNFRQGAINNSIPFRDDPLRKQFHLALMETASRIDHVTVLKVGHRIAAAHIGVVDNGTVYLGIFTHSPFVAKYSPGKLFLLLLAKFLAGEGVGLFDLTPGGYHWKDGIANDHEEVGKLTIYRGRTVRGLQLMRRGLTNFAKTIASRVGVNPKVIKDELKELLPKLRRIRPQQIALRVIGAIYEHAELRIYRQSVKAAEALSTNRLMDKDNLSDLLNFEPLDRWQSKQSFLAGALYRLEKGEHVYTYAREGRLLHYGWLIENQQKAFLTKVQQEFVFPEGSTLLYDFYTHPAAQGHGLYQMSLKQMLSDAAQSPATTHVYTPVSASDRAASQVIESIGFDYQCSLRYSRFFNAIKKEANQGGRC